MTAMINQEALATAKAVLTELARQYDLHNDPGVSDLYDEQAFPIHMPLGMLRGAKNTLAALNLEALPHVDRAGVLEHAGDYSPVAILTSLLRVTEQTVELTNGPFKALYQLQAKALAAAIRALAQPAVNTSPEGVSVSGKNEHVPEGVGGWKPIETAPKDGTTILCYFPLEGLTDAWCRVVPVAWHQSQRGGEGGWIFASRAASGFSRGFQPTHWMPLPAIPSPTDERSK